MLSKLLYVALLPSAWLVLLAVAAVFDWRPQWRRRWRRGLLALVLVGTNLALANEAMRAWELPAVPLSAVPPHDAGVLLTGITNQRHSPHDRVYLTEGADRLMHTLWLYRAGRIRRIIISGGSGSLLLRKGQRTEAAELLVLLQLAGVPRSAVLLEDRSHNTRENALFTKELLARHPDIKSLVLVTSAFHQRRAIGCFEQAGLPVTPFPAAFYSVDRSLWADYWLIPSVEALEQWTRLLHEISGYLTYKILGYC
ncbi:YdcF family protein [Hymenobacter lutimineralis]|uniref:YdcF family protein n=1 Tax=Hymenobacter lutimineralis TaxID=2606448 RepID=A0A5D6UZV2_9BACT|nr:MULTISPECIES: YdcF family protein [Hymenobacter]QIX63142.1 YdcF family protein [Hymenobacter sp. BT18]TYZ07884.1 YdcF family protein [Hymenobacter lutimineralis]